MSDVAYVRLVDSAGRMFGTARIKPDPTLPKPLQVVGHIDYDEADHLTGRCGTCTHWNSWQMGIGYCELDKTGPGAPMRSLEGGIETRIDFGCLWWSRSTRGAA